MLKALSLYGSGGDGAGDVKDDRLKVFLFVEFAIDGGESTEKNLSKIGQDGGTAGGDAVLDEEDGDLGEKVVNARSGLESREQADESGR